MKTKLILLATLFLLVSCESGGTTENLNKTANSKFYQLTNSPGFFGSLGLIDYKTKGMHYKVFQTSNGGVDIINITKDSLEIVKLKQDIKDGH